MELVQCNTLSSAACFRMVSSLDWCYCGVLTDHIRSRCTRRDWIGEYCPQRRRFSHQRRMDTDQALGNPNAGRKDFFGDSGRYTLRGRYSSTDSTYRLPGWCGIHVTSKRIKRHTEYGVEFCRMCSDYLRLRNALDGVLYRA